jgi:Arc/MetJ-type ribon-helix-helix transcriptional regulator
MIKRKAAPKLKQYAFTLGEYHTNLIDRLIEKYGFTSGSDVVRQAIIKLHSSFEPPYRTPTAAGKVKQKKLDQIQEQEDIPERDFANTLGLHVFTARDGSEFVMHRGLGHGGFLEPLAGIKEWAATHEWEITQTKRDRASEPDDYFLARTGIRSLLAEHNIDWDEQVPLVLEQLKKI